MTTRQDLNYLVEFDPASPSCSPNPLPVKASTTITWKMKSTGYTFTGVTIDGTSYTLSSPGTGEFNSLTIGSQGNKSTMTIVDTIADRSDHKYTLNYYDDDEPDVPLTYDPTIRNQD